MLLKVADDHSEDIDELKALLNEPKLSSFKRQLISEDLWNLEKGAEGEQKVAYYLDFHFKSYKRTILLHDLRLELSNGKVAQIDHLIINRFLEIYVLESKNWNVLTIDESGDCTTGESKTIGVENPHEQCKRHAEVLTRVFEIDSELKKLAPRFAINSRVLVAPKCHLKAPHHRKWYLKADAFHTAWCKEIEDDTPNMKNILSLTRMSSVETLKKIGARLIELHEPLRPDWRAKFGLPTHATPMTAEKVIAGIPGLAECVPRKGANWFVLQGKPTEETKKAIKAAGYRPQQQENGEWIWRLKR